MRAWRVVTGSNKDPIGKRFKVKIHEVRMMIGSLSWELFETCAEVDWIKILLRTYISQTLRQSMDT
jgi:hypothetical protein